MVDPNLVDIFQVHNFQPAKGARKVGLVSDSATYHSNYLAYGAGKMGRAADSVTNHCEAEFTEKTEVTQVTHVGAFNNGCSYMPTSFECTTARPRQELTTWVALVM